MKELPAYIPKEPLRANLDKQGCWQGCGCGCIPVLALAAGLTVAAIASMIKGDQPEGIVADQEQISDSDTEAKINPELLR